MKAISLFTGLGGLDFGFEAGGFETRVALELDPVACRAIKLNRPWGVIEADIATVNSSEILGKAGLRPRESFVLIGGPPCQPFSKSGYWATGDAGRLNDPRAHTLSEYLRVLRDTLPEAFLLENVPGLKFHGKSEGIEAIRREIEEINAQKKTSYRIAVGSLNAAEFGVPQLRERVFVIGSREGIEFKFPSPTHASPDRLEAQGPLEPFHTAWDALGDLPAEPNDEDLRMTGKWADLLATIPEGQNYLWHTRRGDGEEIFGWRRRYWSFMLKLSKRLPSWTIQAQPGPATGPFHWRNRKLSAVELGRLQTFPDGLVYECRRAEIQKLAGNAVPSALAEVLAREIAVQLLRRPRNDKRLELLPKRRDDAPEPEPTALLPKKYEPMIGRHEEHPGTGKGRRALVRAIAAEWD